MLTSSAGGGEGFMLDLAERVTSGRDVREIPNGAYQSGGRTTLNDLRPLIADLDTLPLLDFAFEEEYVLDPTGSLVPNTNMRDEPIVLFSGSRGCNNSCTYCSNSQLKNLYRGKGPYARKMSVARFVEAAREYRRMFPRLEHFYFTDEDFFARPVEEMRELAETYPADVGIPFECMASPPADHRGEGGPRREGRDDPDRRGARERQREGQAGDIPTAYR